MCVVVLFVVVVVLDYDLFLFNGCLSLPLTLFLSRFCFGSLLLVWCRRAIATPILPVGWTAVHKEPVQTKGRSESTQKKAQEEKRIATNQFIAGPITLPSCPKASNGATSSWTTETSSRSLPSRSVTEHWSTPHLGTRSRSSRM